MNRKRRKKLTEVFDRLAEMEEVLEGVKQEEKDSYDNLPYSLQNAEKGEEMQNYMEMLDEVIGYIQDASSVIEQI